MRYYFAGAYARRAELAGYAERMADLPGHYVTSTWLTDDQAGLDAGFSAGQLVGDNIAQAWKYGARDMEDVLRSDAIVSFTGEGGRGGRHVEHGLALALDHWDNGCRLIVVGPREHVFHCYPATEVYPDFDAFLKHEMNREDEK